MARSSRPTGRGRWAKRIRRLMAVTANLLVLACLAVLLYGGAAGAVPTAVDATATPAASAPLVVAEASPSPLPSELDKSTTILKESVINHWGKLLFRWVYWNMLLPDRLPLPAKYRPPRGASAKSTKP